MNKKIICIGASCGGIEALDFLLSQLSPLLPPILIVQHISPAFALNLVARYTQRSSLNVVAVSAPIKLQTSTVYFPNSDNHLVLEESCYGIRAKADPGPKLNFSRPSVNALFNSCAKIYSNNALGIIMTGMGDDGATGLAQMRLSGARTIAQDKKSSTVYGMPSAAIKQQAVDKIYPLKILPSAIKNWARSPIIKPKYTRDSSK